jgi:hypothetical protein
MDMHFTLGNIISLISIIIGLIVGFWRLNVSLKDGFSANIKSVDEKFHMALDTHVREEEEKRRRMYDRIDEIKKDSEVKFVSKELINLMHEGTARNLLSLEAKLDKLVTDFRGDLNEVRKGQNDLRETILKSALLRQLKETTE